MTSRDRARSRSLIAVPLDELLQPISPASRAGKDLSEEPELILLQQAIRPPSYGREPDYDLAERIATELLATKSKDLQVAVFYAMAVVQRRGFGGLRQGFELLVGLLATYWDDLYPREVAYRRGPLATLATEPFTIPLQLLPLNEAGNTFWDYRQAASIPTAEQADSDEKLRARRERLLAEGKIPMEVFQANVAQTPAAFYKQVAADLSGALAALRQLDALTTERFGKSDAPSYRDLRLTMEAVQTLVEELLAAKRAADPDAIEMAASSADLANDPSADVVAPPPDPDTGLISETPPGAFDATHERDESEVLASMTESVPSGSLNARPTYVQDVLLGASAPRSAGRGDEFTARFVAYVAEEEQRIRELLTDLSERSASRLGVQSLALTIGTPVTVRLAGRGLDVSPAARTFAWNGQRIILEFDVLVSEAARPGSTCVLKFDVVVADLVVTTIRCDLSIAPERGLGEIFERASSVPRTAFASYASQDRDRVIDRVAALKSVAHMDVFLDHLSLSIGERWRERLNREILAREVFLLFWSSHARASTWVTWEWQTVLRVRGLDAILPQPLESVAAAPVPPELAELHFADPQLLLRSTASPKG